MLKGVKYAVLNTCIDINDNINDNSTLYPKGH